MRQRVLFLQRTQARRIWRADVEHDVVGEIAQLAERVQIIIRGFLQWRGLRFADVYPDWNGGPATARAQLREPPGNNVSAVIVETEAIDQCLSLGVPKDARLRVSGLRLRCHRADLHEPEAECRPYRQRDAVLV